MSQPYDDEGEPIPAVPYDEPRDEKGDPEADKVPTDAGWPLTHPAALPELAYAEIATDEVLDDPEAQQRAIALRQARDVLVGDQPDSRGMFGVGSDGGDLLLTTRKRYAGDLLLLAEYIRWGLLPGEVEEVDTATPDTDLTLGLLLTPDAGRFVEVVPGGNGVPTVIRTKSETSFAVAPGWTIPKDDA
jgi:hypothetical protein